MHPRQRSGRGGEAPEPDLRISTSSRPTSRFPTGREVRFAVEAAGADAFVSKTELAEALIPTLRAVLGAPGSEGRSRGGGRSRPKAPHDRGDGCPEPQPATRERSNSPSGLDTARSRIHAPSAHGAGDPILDPPRRPPGVART